MENAPVLDTDVLIDYLRGAGPGCELVHGLRNALAFRVTAVTAFELALGRSYAHDPSPVDALLAAPLLAFTRSSALRSGSLLCELRASGAGLDVRDAMQAGICLDCGLPLITRNVRHFARVSELRVVEPREWS